MPVDLALPTLEGAGGYAREMSEERAQRQRELLAPYVAAADALITTAAVPGRTAPILVTAEMVAAMKPGSVVVDLAADSGGNVEGVVPGRALMAGSVQLWGGSNVASQMPSPASRLYAQNVWQVITADDRPGRLRAGLRRRDRGGHVRHPERIDHSQCEPGVGTGHRRRRSR